MLFSFASLLLVSLGLWESFVFAANGPPASARSHIRSDESHVDQPRGGAAASSSATCSRIGVDVLKQGGNAADAMVATQFCLGVTVMYLTGIGGGGFLLVRSSNGSYENVDFREAAPAAAFQDMYNANITASLVGGLASGIPGEIRGLQYLHDKYGRLPWGRLIGPSVLLARFGFPVNTELAQRLNALGPQSFLAQDPAWAIDFAPNGTLLGLGDILTRKRYADLLETIAAKGPDAFYTGAIAKATIATLRATNGTMTLDDLASYKVISRAPVAITYRGYKLTSCGAPSSGAVALNILKTVEGYPDFGWASTLNLSTHRLDEAMRFGYGARANLGDPSFNATIIPYQTAMIQEATAAEIRGKISDTHTLPVSAYDPDGLESLETPGTSHAVTADGSGMAVSLTSTINLGFGSKVMVAETGLIMNNEMNDFSVPNASNFFGYIPSPSNFIKPGKRPLSSITPVIVEYLANNSLHFAVGAAGGSRIITATVQSLWHVLDQNYTITDALKAPRLHDQLSPNEIFFEYEYNNATIDYLVQLGHNVTWSARLSDVNALMRYPNGTFEGVGEPAFPNAGGFAF